MSTDTQTIITGQDPRALPEFSAMREEINKSCHPALPEMNWKLVESLALTVFKANGVDLHTACYYTLARTRSQGVAGLCEGVELLAALIGREWNKFWPQSGAARSEMLDWFNARAGNYLRQQLTFSPADLPHLYRVERGLQVICDKLQQVELKRIPRVENLLYFVQNARKRCELPHEESATKHPDNTTVRTLVYVPEKSFPQPQPQPIQTELPEVRIAAPQVTDSPAIRKMTQGGNGVKGFILGMLCSIAAIVVCLVWTQLEDFPHRLPTQTTISPLQMLESDRLIARMGELQTREQWINSLKERAENSPKMLGWQQTRGDLRSFADLLVQREQAKEGFTISYIKTFVYQAERSLNQEIPLEYLLTQYEQAQSSGKSSDMLEKQINERLDGVLSRWLLLTQLRSESQSSSQAGN